MLSLALGTETKNKIKPENMNDFIQNLTKSQAYVIVNFARENKELTLEFVHLLNSVGSCFRIL